MFSLPNWLRKIWLFPFLIFEMHFTRSGEGGFLHYKTVAILEISQDPTCWVNVEQIGLQGICPRQTNVQMKPVALSLCLFTHCPVPQAASGGAAGSASFHLPAALHSLSTGWRCRAAAQPSWPTREPVALQSLSSPANWITGATSALRKQLPKLPGW